MLRFLPVCALLLSLLFAPATAADTHPVLGGGVLPSGSYTPDQLHTIVSPNMGAGEVHNQPGVVNGWLWLAGNAKHSLWDISDPSAPEQLSAFESPYADGEAESHTLSFARTADGRHLAVTISGHGVDLWDVSDATAPLLLSAMELEGIDYGDNTHAVWGVFWQGHTIWVGGTNTGVHVIDASVPESPSVITRLPAEAMGGVSAGPVFAMGNVLVVAPPKNGVGIATVDIGDPSAPALLDFHIEETKSYIGWVYGAEMVLLDPFRAFDVTSNPTDILHLGEVESPQTEYVSFGDGHAFLGSVRPVAGVYKVPLGADLSTLDFSTFIGGRPEGDEPLRVLFQDDQFSVPVGNLLVLSDDEVHIGSALVVHDTAPDVTPPRVMAANPPDGAVGQPVTSRIGLSFSDQIDLRTVDTASLIVRPLGGDTIPGMWGNLQTHVSFAPAQPLQSDTTYEIVVPAGGITDLAGNPITEAYTSTFSTGHTSPPTCEFDGPWAVEVGVAASFEATDAGDGATYDWDFGGGADTGRTVQHTWSAPTRLAVKLTVGRGGASRVCTRLVIVHRPLAAVPPRKSSGVHVDEARGRAWVVNPDADTVAIVDLATLGVVAEMEAGVDPRTVTQADDGTIWIASRGDDTLRGLDPEDGSPVATVVLRHGAAPHAVVAAHDGTSLVAGRSSQGFVDIIDLDTLEVATSLAGGIGGTRALALRGDGRALATRLISADLPGPQGEVFVLDVAARTRLDPIPLGLSPGPDEPDQGRGLPNYLLDVAISPDGAVAAVAAKKDNIERGEARDGLPLNTTNSVRSMVAWLDVDARVEWLDERRDLDDRSLPSAVVFSPLGDLLFVATMGSNTVDVIDAYDGRLVAGFATGLAPSDLALTESGLLLVRDDTARTLSVIDVAGLLAGEDSAGAQVAQVQTVVVEPLDPQVLLGKQLFHNADSREMSQDGYISCAACHLDGGHDGRTWDFTDRGEGLRNTIDLRGRAGTDHGPLHWSANFDEVQDFENDIRGAFGGSGLMSDEAFHTGERSHPLGDAKAGVSERLDALAAYVASFDTFPRSPHRNPDGTLTERAIAGADLFRRLDCLDCHADQRLTDSPLGVRHDVYTLTEQSGGRLGGELDGLDTPTLRGVWDTAPFLHDGSGWSVIDTLLIGGHGDAWQLTSTQLDELNAFLMQLENEDIELERIEGLPEPDYPIDWVDGGPEGSGSGDAPGVDAGGCVGGHGDLGVLTILACLMLAALRRRLLHTRSS